MTSIRLDKVIMSSFHESFRNRERKTTSITVSGSIPAFNATAFTVDIPLIRAQAAFEVYYQRQGNYPKRSASGCRVVTDITWTSGTVYFFALNPSDNILRIQMYVTNNTGSPVSITSQTLDVLVYVFDTPFVA